MLAIGAVIGAGIFGSIGSAAAGQVGPTARSIRVGAGPALVLSFVLLGACCALAGLCYAEMAAMIPQAGSAYAYTYATLGELVAWIIGWDLILEYAVGNVAVAISWADYFKSLLAGWVDLPAWLTTGYRTALLSSDPAIQGLLDSAPHLLGIPILINVPAFAIVMLITWLLLRGARESSTANNVMVVVKLAVLALFIVAGAHAHQRRQLHAVRAERLHRHSSRRGDRLLRVHRLRRDFDRGRRDEEPPTEPADRHPGRPGDLYGHLHHHRRGAHRHGAVHRPRQGRRPARVCAQCRRACSAIAKIVALGAVFSMAAVLLVFQYGQPRIFFAMARDGLLPQWAARVNPKTRIPYVTTLVTGLFVAAWSLIGDAGETYDLTNIGTLFAFVLVCLGVIVLRHTDPSRPRPFRVKFVHLVGLLGAALCIFVMKGLPRIAWERFGIWLLIGLVLYFAYGYSHSRLRRTGSS